MNRRHFLQRTAGLLIAAPFAPLMGSRSGRALLAIQRQAIDPRLGISIRFIREFELCAASGRAVVNRLDAFMALPYQPTGSFLQYIEREKTL